MEAVQLLKSGKVSPTPVLSRRWPCDGCGPELQKNKKKEEEKKMAKATKKGK